jgi:hypothetical protein
VVPAIVAIVTHSKYSRDITVFHPPSALSFLRLLLLLLLHTQPIMAANNDLRGWLMSGVSGIGEFFRTNCDNPNLIHQSLRPWFVPHLHRCYTTAILSPQELPNCQQQWLLISLSMLERRCYGTFTPLPHLCLQY